MRNLEFTDELITVVTDLITAVNYLSAEVEKLKKIENKEEAEVSFPDHLYSPFHGMVNERAYHEYVESGGVMSAPEALCRYQEYVQNCWNKDIYAWKVSGASYTVSEEWTPSLTFEEWLAIA